jgi:hypothetical protein
MTPAQVANVAHIHAEYVLQARSLEASADRHESVDPDRASQARDDAALCRAKAYAIEALLKATGAQVLFPEPGQLSLFGDGQ